MTRLESRPLPERLWLRSPAPAPRRPAGRSLIMGLALVGLVTLLFLAWLSIRIGVRPGWIGNLPPVLAELLWLVELAGGATLVLIWAGLAWRWRRGSQPAAPGPDLNDLYALSPKAFERYVAGMFRQKGYRVTVRGRSGDLGVDLELHDPHGKRAIVQCKRYQNTVGPDVVRELYGTLIHERAAHAFLTTTAEISDGAREWAQGKPLTLIDGPTLVEIARSLQNRLA